MRAEAGILSEVRANRGMAFWLWCVVKLSLGLSQMAGAVWVAFLFYRDGMSEQAFWVFVAVAIATTASMILFRVLDWKPAKSIN